MTIDDLFFVAVSLQRDLRGDFDRLVGAVEKGGGGAGPAPGAAADPAKGWADKLAEALNKVVKGAGVAQAGLAAFAGTFDKVLAALGGGMAKFVQLASPATVFRFNVAVENAMSALGRILVPVMERFTAIVQQLGNAIESLSPQTKQLAGGLAAGGGLAGVFGALAAAGTLLVQTFGRVPLLIGAVAGIVAGVVAATSSGQALAASFAGLAKAVGGLVEVLAHALLPVFEFVLVPVIKTLAAAATDAADALRVVVNGLRELAGAGALNYDPNAHTAQATRPAAIGDLRGYANRAYASAFNSQANSTAEKQLAEAEKHTGLLARLVDDIGSGGGRWGSTSLSASDHLGRVGGAVGGEDGRTVGRTAGRFVNGVVEPFVAAPRTLARMAASLFG